MKRHLKSSPKHNPSGESSELSSSDKGKYSKTDKIIIIYYSFLTAVVMALCILGSIVILKRRLNNTDIDIEDDITIAIMK